MKGLYVSALFALASVTPLAAQDRVDTGSSYQAGYQNGYQADSYDAGYAYANTGFVTTPGWNAEAAAIGNGDYAEAYSPASYADPYTVYVEGEYIGRDPDPNVRLMLRKDWKHE